MKMSSLLFDVDPTWDCNDVMIVMTVWWHCGGETWCNVSQGDAEELRPPVNTVCPSSPLSCARCFPCLHLLHCSQWPAGRDVDWQDSPGNVKSVSSPFCPARATSSPGTWLSSLACQTYTGGGHRVYYREELAICKHQPTWCWTLNRHSHVELITTRELFQ